MDTQNSEEVTGDDICQQHHGRAVRLRHYAAPSADGDKRSGRRLEGLHPVSEGLIFGIAEVAVRVLGRGGKDAHKFIGMGNAHGMKPEGVHQAKDC